MQETSAESDRGTARFCSRNASETRLLSQTLISHGPDRISAGSLPAAGSEPLFHPAHFTEVPSVLHEMFSIFPPVWFIIITYALLQC